MCGKCCWCLLKARERELLARWGSSLEWLGQTIQGLWLGNLRYEYCRGFVSSVTLSCSFWLTHGERLLRAAPLERVTLTQVAIGAVRRENDALVCPVFSWVHGSVSLTLQVQDGQLWYWMEPDRAGGSFGVRVFAVEGDIPAPRWVSIEDSFRGYWNPHQSYHDRLASLELIEMYFLPPDRQWMFDPTNPNRLLVRPEFAEQFRRLLRMGIIPGTPAAPAAPAAQEPLGTINAPRPRSGNAGRRRNSRRPDWMTGRETWR